MEPRPSSWSSGGGKDQVSVPIVIIVKYMVIFFLLLGGLEKRSSWEILGVWIIFVCVVL